MSEDDNNELSDEEYDALLRDLEGRAGDSEAAPEMDDDGDIDAFLEEIESQSEAESKTATRTREEDDDLAAQFADLEEKDELAVPEDVDLGEEKKKRKKDKGKSKKAAREDEAEGAKEDRSRGTKVAIKAGKVALWAIPAVVLWWVLGVYLAQWVSAGWLIAVVSAMAVVGVPMGLRRVVRRGRYRHWLLGTSVVATVALVAPMPNVAGEQMSHYGHWPSSVVAEVTGADADIGLVTRHAAAAGWLGTTIATVEQPNWEARQLGTVVPLDMAWPPDEETLERLEEGLELPGTDEAAETAEPAAGSEEQPEIPTGE